MSSVESISNATILCVQRYIVLYPKLTMPASRTASFQQHENRKRKHLKASRGRKQGSARKTPKREKCSLTSEKAKKSILLWLPCCCCCRRRRRRHKQSATVFYDEQLLSTECTQENAWKAGRRSKWQQTKNQESRYSSRQSTCCSVGIFSTTEKQRKTKTKRFKKNLKKLLVQARLLGFFFVFQQHTQRPISCKIFTKWISSKAHNKLKIILQSITTKKILQKIRKTPAGM